MGRIITIEVSGDEKSYKAMLKRIVAANRKLCGLPKPKPRNKKRAVKK